MVTELKTKQLTWWPSPAKLNLFLHINGQYENGYHQLQSLFQLLDFGDELAFEVNNSGKVHLANPIEGVPDSDNLIIKAALLLKQTAPSPEAERFGCTIYLKKKLPMGGGIGGGSSNAATTLLVLNHLWKCNLDLDTLAKLGLSLGADVPIFIYGKTAFAEGVGEKLNFTSVPSSYYLVVFPNCHVSTADIFKDPDLPRNTPKIDFSEYQFSNTRNDCQKLVCERHVDVANALQWLLEYAPSRMTGTGACIFAMFEHKKDALHVQSLLPNKMTSFVAKGVDSSPLHNQIQAHI
ncbi:4-(cytidine 5'-diphospho)-2-C-methyl-D-erythritol kinase [Paraglaciecola sp. 2405UD69-4]|uniref:4-(cytidine 5'-diphospho)-2-C-methyl-D-erythritol kinase n=1 Tax=Paraglaciecola sp. 2405UD69-4 TaxID=3391836 RepID=UPI0039C97AB6